MAYKAGENGGTTWTVGDVLVQRQVDREVVKRPAQQGNDPPLCTRGRQVQYLTMLLWNVFHER